MGDEGVRIVRGKAIIIGGGIGGVAAGVALARAGFEIAIYEQASALREVGAGLTVWPNAMKALRLLGLDAAVWAIGRPFGVGQVFDPRGRVLVEGARREILEQRFGWPGTVLHRHQLLQLLAQFLPSEAIHLGMRCQTIQQDRAGVTATFTNGHQDRGDVLIGADGLNSTIRAALLGRQRPRYAGYVAYRGINRFPFESDIAYETWGIGQRFGFVPGPGGENYWWAALSGPERSRSEADARKDLLAIYGDWFDPIPAMIEATLPETILCNAIYDRPPTSRWSVGRATLLGDAAHPLTPDLGQGACLALEDAVDLGKILAEQTDIPEALRIYEARRLPRASFLIRHSRWMGRLGQINQPTLAWLRNTLVGMTPSLASLHWLSWQFAFEPIGSLG